MQKTRCLRETSGFCKLLVEHDLVAVRRSAAHGCLYNMCMCAIALWRRERTICAQRVELPQQRIATDYDSARRDTLLLREQLTFSHAAAIRAASRECGAKINT